MVSHPDSPVTQGEGGLAGWAGRGKVGDGGQQWVDYDAHRSWVVLGATVKIIWLTLLALSPSLASADPPPPLPPPPHAAVIGNPEWLRRPSAPLYPVLASRARVSGVARMLCVVTTEGLLEKCEVISETPPGYGFGQAALDMAGQMQMRPRTRDGQPVGGWSVVVPVRFQLPGAPPPASP